MAGPSWPCHGNGHAAATSQIGARIRGERCGRPVTRSCSFYKRRRGRGAPWRDTLRLANGARYGYDAPTEVAAMKKLAAAVLIVVLLLSVTAVPSEAWGRQAVRGCCWGGWWLPGAIFGGLALGAAVAAASRRTTRTRPRRLLRGASAPSSTRRRPPTRRLRRPRCSARSSIPMAATCSTAMASASRGSGSGFRPRRLRLPRHRSASGDAALTTPTPRRPPPPAAGVPGAAMAKRAGHLHQAARPRIADRGQEVLRLRQGQDRHVGLMRAHDPRLVRRRDQPEQRLGQIAESHGEHLAVRQQRLAEGAAVRDNPCRPLRICSSV